jgi:hypothetical protein
MTALRSRYTLKFLLRRQMWGGDTPSAWLEPPLLVEGFESLDGLVAGHDSYGVSETVVLLTRRACHSSASYRRSRHPRRLSNTTVLDRRTCPTVSSPSPPAARRPWVTTV